MGKTAILLAAISLMAPPAALAQTRVTVAQMEQELASLSHQNEAAAAPQLARFELTQRVSPARLAAWQSQFKGELARQILLYLADASATRDLPASDLPSAPPPDQPTRDAILQRAREYVRTMRPRLPNFSAIRTVTSYEESTLDQMENEEHTLQFLQLTRARLGFRSLGAVAATQQLFLQGSAENLVTVQKGSEIQSPPKSNSRQRRLLPRGLASAGEFGPILSLVDEDSTHGVITWHHWENGPAGLLAVYRYSVPASESHFAIFSPMENFPGLAHEEHPAYHGEIAVDPPTGSMLRIVIEADSDHEATPGSMVVEYGSVEIGAKTYICPLRAVAISRVTDPGDSHQPALPRTYVNDTTFTNYHLFRAEMRILP